MEAPVKPINKTPRLRVPKSFVGLFPYFGLLYVVQGFFDLRLHRFRQVFQNIGDLVHPTALLVCIRPNLENGLPETQRTITNSPFGRYLEVSLHQIG